MRYRKEQVLLDVATREQLEVYQTPMDVAVLSDIDSPFRITYGLRKEDGSTVIVEMEDVHNRAKYLPQEPYYPFATTPRYGRHCLVREVATGISLIVVGMPAENRDSESFEPSYVVQGPDAVRWSIPQRLFEDGKFELVERVEKPDPSAS